MRLPILTLRRKCRATILDPYVPYIISVKRLGQVSVWICDSTHYHKTTYNTLIMTKI